jgi:CSLREA domain-containing protein
MLGYRTSRGHLLFLVALGVLAACRETNDSPLGPRPQFAQGDNGTWTVNSLADPGAGTCDDTECTLREAIAAAASGDQIVFGSGLQGDISLAGEMEITDKALTITGGGRIALDAHRASSVLVLASTAGNPKPVVSLAGLTVKNAGPSLAGIRVDDADLTLNDVSVLNNAGGGLRAFDAALTIRNSFFSTNTGNNGGAIYVAATSSLTLVNSTLEGNHALDDGGAIFSAGTIVVTGSTISGNFASEFGAGLFSDAGASATVVRSTISGNNAFGGGGILNWGILELRSSTITRNIAFDGAGLAVGGTASATVANSIIAGNTPVDANDCVSIPGGVTSAGYNLITTAVEECAFNSSGDVVIDPTQVFTQVIEQNLETNGGGTNTHALVANGLAVDAGSCPGETIDQRGFSRPFDIPLKSNVADGCDKGAYELHSTASQQVTDISSAVSSFTLASGTANSLQVKLNSVSAALQAGDTSGACASLRSFISEVRAQAGKKKLSATQAAALIAQATALMTDLGCS